MLGIVFTMAKSEQNMSDEDSKAEKKKMLLTMFKKFTNRNSQIAQDTRKTRYGMETLQEVTVLHS